MIESVATITVEVPTLRAEAMPSHGTYRLWLPDSSFQPFQRFELQRSVDLTNWTTVQAIDPSLAPPNDPSLTTATNFVDVPSINTIHQFFRVIPK